ncbi:alpha/beta fold hydrolase [Flavobacterium sp. H122]|uniref:alpha/beta hydrolase n=1 Tax=Flavobacterium sp. H122 TaxID=2529860 RepID=UPI0010AAD1D1|nr:alpha/beta fold hydrolase [Flavobacterium sp. H122]
MKNNIIKLLNLSVLLFVVSITLNAQNVKKKNPLIIEEQGSFAIGGAVITTPGTFDPKNPTSEGQTLHVDHAYAFYQIPKNPQKLPLVFWHGFGQTSRTWGTTPDGREGFQSLFLRKGFSTYVIDQPRRGYGGRSNQSITINAKTDDQYWFTMFRIGIGSEYFPGVQFSKAPETLNQFFRQTTPDVGSIDFNVNTDAVSELFNKIGKGILITHSHSGGQGWTTAIKNPNIKAIVSYEPGSGFLFPQDEVPEPMQSAGGILEAIGVPKEDFMKLTKIPIVIYYGDYIPATPSDNYGTDNWRTRLTMARLFVDAINKYGGNATVVHLPEIGIKGNTHFPFSDLNNIEIAYLMHKWLKEKGF